MATGSRKRVQSKKKTEADSKSLRVEPNYQRDYPSVYANYASVNQTPFEMSIDFCTIAPPNQIDLEKNILYAPISVRVLIPHTMTEGLIKALQGQLEKYQKISTELNVDSEGAD